MKNNRKLKDLSTSINLLALDLGYEREEINEPLGIDIVVSDLKRQFGERINISTKYCPYHLNEQPVLSGYELILVSTKITSFHQLCIIADAATVPLIIGGALATYEPDYLAKRFPNAVICIGESETNINSIVSVYLSTLNKDLFFQELICRDINNICFMTNSKLYASKRSFANLSQCEMPNHEKVKDMLNVNGLVRMETSRGCPWNQCTFCVMPWRFYGRKWSSFSYAKIEKELRFLIRQGVKQIYFTDEDFIGCEDHIVKLCNIIYKTSETNCLVTFGGSTSVKTLLSLEPRLDYYLELMKTSGITTFFLGVESGSNSQLHRYNKGVTVNNNLHIIQKLEKHGLIVDPGFIMFDAETNMDELHENLVFLKHAGFENNIGHFTKKMIVLAHTGVFSRYSMLGLLVQKIDPNTCSYDYVFQDKTIRLLWPFLEKIDQSIMREAYRIQFLYRASVAEQEKAVLFEKLAEIRRTEYRFLCECDEQYHNFGVLDDDYLQNLTATYLAAFQKRSDTLDSETRSEKYSKTGGA